MRLTGFGLALFCLFFSNRSASAQPPAQNQPIELRKAYCKAWSSDQATIYFSDVFEINVPYHLGTRGIEDLFETYLKQSYGYNSTPLTPVILVLSESVAASEKSKQQDQAQYTMMGKQLVETRWKLSRQQAAALAALPTPEICNLGHGETGPCPQTVPSAGTPGAGTPSTPGASAAANANAILYELCRAVTSVRTGGKYTTYFSGVMPRASINDADYSAAFAAFLAKKYGVQYVTPECGGSRSQAEAQNWMEEGWWKVNPNFSTAVQTGWTYSPANPPEPPALAASSAAVTSYTVCVAGDAATAYVSGAFAVTKMDGPAWSNAFAQFLAQKYAYKGGGVGCNNMDLEHAPTFLKNRIAALRANKKQVVETGWTYGSSATAPPGPTPAGSYAPSASGPPAAAVAVTAPKVTHAVCWADFDPHTSYYSAVFDGTVGDYNVWMPAFKTFLEQKYHYTGLVRCTKRPDKADAQKYLDNMVSTARGMTLGDGSKAKVIETGWQYK
jgi:hypothetical protein